MGLSVRLNYWGKNIIIASIMSFHKTVGGTIDCIISTQNVDYAGV